MKCTWRYAGFALAAGAAFASMACGKGDAPKGDAAVQADPDEIPKGDAGKRMYFEKRCKEGHAGLCGELGLMWDRGWGGAKDQVKAKEYYKMGCDFAVLTSCEALGVELTSEKALQILDQKCAAGSAFACNNEGHVLLNGADVAADPAKARLLLEKGCAGGYAASCRGLAHIWRDGVGVAKDEAKAKEYDAKGDAAEAAVNALEVKYFHIPPRDQLPVGHASQEFIDSIKGSDPAADEMNKKVLEDAAKKAAEEIGKEKAAEPSPPAPPPPAPKN
jgi:TPR repeat protein